MKQRKYKWASASKWTIVHLRAFALCAMACIVATAQGQLMFDGFQEGVSAGGTTTFTIKIKGGNANETVLVTWFQPPPPAQGVPIQLNANGTFCGNWTAPVGAQPTSDLLVLFGASGLDFCAATWSTELVRAPISILWDQSDYDEGATAFVDQVFDDFPDFDSYLVTDIDTGGDSWVIDSVVTFFTNGNGWADAGVTQGRLNVFPKTGDLPDGADDPGAGQVVDIIILDLGGTIAVIASGLKVELAPGEYWVGLTPIANFGAFGQEFHRGAPIIAVDTAWRNPGGGFGVGGEWSTTGVLGAGWIGAFDAAIAITGEIDGGGGCEDCGDLGCTDCFAAGGDPFCNDQCGGAACVGCCDIVCAQDQSCCVIAWDEVCAAIAAGLCRGNDCPWDLDGDESVGTGDLILLLGGWGDPYGTEDLIALLGAWGDCP